MTVRDIYIFESLGRVALDDDDDYDGSEAEALDDVRYARRVRRSPLITERSVRRVARERRAAVIEDVEIKDDADDTPAETAITRAAFGGLGNLGAALAVIGLLIMAAAWTGPSWGWGAGGAISQGQDAYGFSPGAHIAYPYDVGYPDAPYTPYAASAGAFDTAPQPFVDPSRAMFAGGMILLIGLVLLLSRRRSFLLR